MPAITSITRLIPGLALFASPVSAKTHPQKFFKTTAITRNVDTFEHTSNAPAVLKTTPEKTIIEHSATVISSQTSKTAEQLDAAIEALLPEKNKTSNPLYKKGAVFKEMGEKYNVNPITIIAIAMAESGRGVSKAAVAKNNFGGLRGKRGQICFDSPDKCIESMAKLLQKRNNQGLTTISKLGNSGKYCAKSASKNWIKHVNYYIKELEK